MAENAFQAGAQSGAVKAVMRRLQRGGHKRDQGRSASNRASSVTKARAAVDNKKKGARKKSPCTEPLFVGTHIARHQ